MSEPTSAATRSIPPSDELNENDPGIRLPSQNVPTPEAADAPEEPPPVPQQAATQPGSGSHVVVVQQPTHRTTFKEQVVGHAKEIRGSILGNRETKEYGEKILRGEATYPPQA